MDVDTALAYAADCDPSVGVFDACMSTLAAEVRRLRAELERVEAAARAVVDHELATHECDHGDVIDQLAAALRDQ